MKTHDMSYREVMREIGKSVRRALEDSKACKDNGSLVSSRIMREIAGTQLNVARHIHRVNKIYASVRR